MNRQVSTDVDNPDAYDAMDAEIQPWPVDEPAIDMIRCCAYHQSIDREFCPVLTNEIGEYPTICGQNVNHIN